MKTKSLINLLLSTVPPTLVLSQTPTTFATPWPKGSTATPTTPTTSSATFPTEAVLTGAGAPPWPPTDAIIPSSAWSSGAFPTVSWPPIGAGPPHWRPNWPTTGTKPPQIPEWVFRIPKNVLPMRIAHAALAASAFLLFFPIGGVIIRIFDPRLERYSYIVWVHVILQGVGYVLFTAAAGMGIYIAKHLHALSKYHPIIGIFIFALMAVQPVTELLNHYLFERYPNVRYVGYVHLWLGRFLLAAGIVNGGLGFHFAESIPGPKWPQWPKVAYGAIATLVVVIYVAIIIVWTKLNAEGEALHDVDDEETTPRGATAEVKTSTSSGVNATTAADGIQVIPGPAREMKQGPRSNAV
ncbi:uncharacterized protein A1O9_02945 [Exophiala aquamarina CBS 119918]|uniref:Cytochrome b561 domain-containing protein n=1 Tax=Exophiala aquamarina CBS 119918 TaxID=1182545 RepID=A0A072PMS8_9EURO|nr:uncharacterized protein A1O9_02945 [Exophiala aquamarina CBS 119918]KEF61379.1 hypothetical protein A1O9_02945 [Exophiala aquamarina CBS 119918]